MRRRRKPDYRGIRIGRRQADGTKVDIASIGSVCCACAAAKVTEAETPKVSTPMDAMAHPHPAHPEICARKMQSALPAITGSNTAKEQLPTAGNGRVFFALPWRICASLPPRPVMFALSKPAPYTARWRSGAIHKRKADVESVRME